MSDDRETECAAERRDTNSRCGACGICVDDARAYANEFKEILRAIAGALHPGLSEGQRDGLDPKSLADNVALLKKGAIAQVDLTGKAIAEKKQAEARFQTAVASTKKLAVELSETKAALLAELRKPLRAHLRSALTGNTRTKRNTQ